MTSRHVPHHQFNSISTSLMYIRQRGHEIHLHSYILYVKSYSTCLLSYKIKAADSTCIYKVMLALVTCNQHCISAGKSSKSTRTCYTLDKNQVYSGIPLMAAVSHQSQHNIVNQTQYKNRCCAYAYSVYVIYL